jgi:hypothetical protein
MFLFFLLYSEYLSLHDCKLIDLFSYVLQDFGYDKRYFSVLEVNKTSYENCIDAGFIKNITGGAGRDVFQLTEEKTYYFINAGGYCWQGMKVAIDVNDYAPAPAPTPGASAINASNIYVLILILMFTSFFG